MAVEDVAVEDVAVTAVTVMVRVTYAEKVVAGRMDCVEAEEAEVAQVEKEEWEATETVGAEVMEQPYNPQNIRSHQHRLWNSDFCSSMTPHSNKLYSCNRYHFLHCLDNRSDTERIRNYCSCKHDSR